MNRDDLVAEGCMLLVVIVLFAALLLGVVLPLIEWVSRG